MKSEDSAALPSPQHTPGPWMIEDDSDIYHCASGELLATVYPMKRDGLHDSWKANAALIIAAPELLAELEHAHGMIRHYLKCGYLPHMSAEEAEQLVRNPDSAIAKAKGETL